MELPNIAYSASAAVFPADFLNGVNPARPRISTDLILILCLHQARRLAVEASRRLASSVPPSTT